MLQELSIRNFALIEEVRVPFGPGLNIVTGETGAGKSIVLDAVNLIMGGRASAEWVRTGADKAVIEAMFLVESQRSRESLQALFEHVGIDWDDNTVIVTREISLSGKSVSRINGRLVNVQTMRQIGAHLIDMAGQHEHQSLQKSEEHLLWIDSFAGQVALSKRKEVEAAFASFQEIRRALEEAAVGEQERIQKIDMYRFQRDEITQVQPVPREEEKLEDERKKLANAERLHQATSSAYDALYEGDDRQGALLDTLHKIVTDLEGATSYDQSLQEILDTVKSNMLQLQDATFELRGYRDDIQFNPGRLAQVEDRLVAINRLQKKYGTTIEEVLQYLKKISAELEMLENHEQHLDTLIKQRQQAETRLRKVALELSAIRQEAAERFETALMEILASLMMPRTQFSVQFSQTPNAKGIEIDGRTVHVHALGIDRVEFLFSPNPGEPMKPLTKIASGGELSRTMLALKTLLADLEDVATLILDEVDSGISGRAAQAVAEKMASIATNRQVICVTHLPQVACMADVHFLITKRQDGERSYTFVQKLQQDGQIEELARMLSGAEVTETTRKHAMEMLDMAHQHKSLLSTSA